MINLNGPKMLKVEMNGNGKCDDFDEEYNDLILSMKAGDYMNLENQENLSRVHVLCCNNCEFLTISLKALQQHVMLLHSIPRTDFNNLTIYSCQQCKCVSTELKLIREHIKMFHNISPEKSSISDTIVSKNATVLTPTHVKNCRKPNHLKLMKTQLKMRKKLLQRKSLKLKSNNSLSSDIDIEDHNNNDCSAINRELKQETINHNTEIVASQDIDGNDPLDMSINSTTCPFKGTKKELEDSTELPRVWKQEPISVDTSDYSINNVTMNNPLLTNPQTCIELIKLTLNQMLNKSAEQNRMAHLGFNPASFLQAQFQLPSNLVPLLLPNLPQGHNPNQSQNGSQFPPNNLEIESIIANIQQQNLLKSVSPKSFEISNPKLTYQPSPMFLNQKMAETQSLFTDNSQKNGSSNHSPLHSGRKTADHGSQSTNKRNHKKQSLPTKVRNSVVDESVFFPKTESAVNENLFNRSFLDSSEVEPTLDHVDQEKAMDGLDCTNISNKSSPNGNDKPHRQNFTTQQNRILSEWFFNHSDKPYPSTEDTKDLSQISGLSYSQVKKWFANKRARSSMNKKSHKSYCMINPSDLSMKDLENNDMLSVSPSSDSHRSYSNQVDPAIAIDFTTCYQDDKERHEN